MAYLHGTSCCTVSQIELPGRQTEQPDRPERVWPDSFFWVNGDQHLNRPNCQSHLH